MPRSSTRPRSSTSTSSTSSQPGQPVGDQQRRAGSRVSASRSATIASAVARVEVLAGLVEDEHGEVGEQRPRDRQALALAAGHARAALADLGVEARRQAAPSSPAAGRRRARRAAPRAVASRRARRRFSSSVLSKTWASWATRPDDAPVVVAVEVRDLHSVERDRPALDRAGTSAARPRASTSRRRWDRRRPRAGRGPGRGPARRAPSGPGRGYLLRRPRTRRTWAPEASATGCAGSATGGGVSSHLEHARGRAAHALEGLGRRGQARDELECDQRDQRDPGEQHAVEPSRAHGGDADEQGAPHREPRAQARQALADAGGARARAGDPCELGVGRRGAPQLRRGGAVGGQLGGALEQVDHRRRQLAARGRLPRLGARGERPRQPWHERRRRAAARPAGSGRRRGASTTPGRPSPRRR